MRNFVRPIFATAFVALLATGGMLSTEASAAPKGAPKGYGNFDGAWSVVINTARGDCGSGLRYGVRIVGGRVMGANGGYSVAGAVAPSGAIRVMVAEAGRSASGSGRLRGNSGGGVWRTSSGECSGSWSAARGGGW
jgi:hypothetical protein